jgi:hypothetical protein
MTQESTARVDIHELNLAVGSDTTFTAFRSAGPCAISVHPSPGATVYVSLTLSQTARIKAGTHRLTAAAIGKLGTAPDGTSAGIVSATDGLELLAPVTGIRFVCVGGTATVELVQ